MMRKLAMRWLSLMRHKWFFCLLHSFGTKLLPNMARSEEIEISALDSCNCFYCPLRISGNAFATPLKALYLEDWMWLTLLSREMEALLSTACVRHFPCWLNNLMKGFNSFECVFLFTRIGDWRSCHKWKLSENVIGFADEKLNCRPSYYKWNQLFLFLLQTSSIILSYALST